MNCKTFEIRDAGTFIPALGVQLGSGLPEDRWLLSRAGFGINFETQSKYIILIKLTGGPDASQYDPYNWPDSTRTMPTAHQYIIDHWNELMTGDVIDVEYILGITLEIKRSERYDQIMD
jgi:hypothetical protein